MLAVIRKRPDAETAQIALLVTAVALNLIGTTLAIVVLVQGLSA